MATTNRDRRDWKSVIWFLLFLIVTIFGSVKDFLLTILGLLNIQLDTFQYVQIGFLVVGVLGMLVVARNSIRKGRATTDARITRLDKFNGWISKVKFELGETVFFNVKFKGLVRFGYYEAVIIRPDKQMRYVWDPETLLSARAETKGSLSGEINHNAQRWSWTIPMDSPVGNYVVRIGIYETYPLDPITNARVRIRRNWLIRKFWRLPIPLASHERRCLAETTVKFSVVEPFSEEPST